MSLKSEVSAEDWKEIAQAPFVTGFAITAADPGGLIGAFQESAAMAKSLHAADGANNELGTDIMEELKSSEGRSEIKDAIKSLVKGQSPDQASKAALARLAQIMTLVSRTAPSHFDDVALLVRRTAHAVAEAAKEGGFLGIGGVAVSEAEKTTLDEIEAVITSSNTV
ncbi:hypothetical protein N9C96_00835 [bacterium]|nr:hypothetical protein [bacterium]